MSSFSTVSKSSKSTEYQTPIEFYEKLDNIFHFSIDPCTTEDNPLGTERFFTIKEDGLDQEWNGNTFCNPPFGRGIGDWLRAMHEESLKYPSFKYVMLLPARTDTKWFQDLLMDKYDRKQERTQIIYFIKGRLKFVNPILNNKQEPAIIGSMLWILNATARELVDLKDVIPGISVFGWYTRSY